MDNNNKADKPVDFSYPEGLWEAAEFCFPDKTREEAEALFVTMIEYVIDR